jgi:hypothetical protein
MRWITREKIKVDGVACPCLIRNFIECEAKFIFLPHTTAWTAITDGIASRLGILPLAWPSRPS